MNRVLGITFLGTHSTTHAHADITYTRMHTYKTHAHTRTHTQYTLAYIHTHHTDSIHTHDTHTDISSTQTHPFGHFVCFCSQWYVTFCEDSRHFNIVHDSSRGFDLLEHVPSIMFVEYCVTSLDLFLASFLFVGFVFSRFF